MAPCVYTMIVNLSVANAPVTWQRLVKNPGDSTKIKRILTNEAHVHPNLGDRRVVPPSSISLNNLTPRTSRGHLHPVAYGTCSLRKISSTQAVLNRKRGYADRIRELEIGGGVSIYSMHPLGP